MSSAIRRRRAAIRHTFRLQIGPVNDVSGYVDHTDCGYTSLDSGSWMLRLLMARRLTTIINDVITSVLAPRKYRLSAESTKAILEFHSL